MWLDEAAKAGQDLDMADEEEKNEDVGESKKHRNMFNAKNGQQFAINNVFFQAGMSSDSEEDESSSDSDDSRDRDGKIMETNLMTSQNYFNQSYQQSNYI